MHKFGWSLVAIGGFLQIAAGFSEADAVLNGLPYGDTALGTLVTPIEENLHIPGGTLGWFVLGAGLICVFAIPAIGKRVK